MTRFSLAAVAAALLLAACTGGVPTTQSAGGSYTITRWQARKIPARFLEALNRVRAAEGLAPVELDQTLTLAATIHSRDMARQQRPWTWGSDGSSPIDRARRAGFTGRYLGEAISETYENELVTLAAWVDDKASRRVVLHPEARLVGLGWYQEPDGKIWWTLEVGAPAAEGEAVAAGSAPATAGG
ncbi:MAG: CAP domain-containing protein [Alphaproteobacteria bacterium]|nr:MAG: CAP domain-containing protein [Alphaproteobacteria bacterium]